MTRLLASYNASGRSGRGLALAAYRENKALSALFALSVAATLLHYVDNILYLHEYPDLPTTQASSIILFFFIMMPFGVAGYWLYVRHRHRLSYYMFYVYCLLNLVVLGHYTPSRLRGGFWAYSLKIHAFIWLEAITAMALLAYVVRLRRSRTWSISTPPAYRRMRPERSRFVFV